MQAMSLEKSEKLSFFLSRDDSHVLCQNRPDIRVAKSDKLKKSDNTFKKVITRLKKWVQVNLFSN